MTIKVTFWQNMPSHHMAPVQRELARLPGYQVTAVFAQDISGHRREMGWSMPELSPAESITTDGDPSRARQFAKQSDGINFFGGFPSGVLKEAFDALPVERGRAKSALILEAGDTHDLKGKLRPIYHAMRVRRIRRRVDFVMAFGSRGVKYYRMCGFDRERLYPFLYQTDFEQQLPATPTSPPIRIVYCGGLYRRKGVDILLRALAPLSHLEWTLEIVGDGPEACKLRQLAERLNLSARVSWSGFVGSSKVIEILRQKDICVVPSRHDGWGMLTNEALSAALAVITAFRVGSKDLVARSGAGRAASRPTSYALRQSLEELLSSPAEINKAKAAAARVRDELTGKPTALYLDAVIRHSFGGRLDRPSPPWDITPAGTNPLDIGIFPP